MLQLAFLMTSNGGEGEGRSQQEVWGALRDTCRLLTVVTKFC